MTDDQHRTLREAYGRDGFVVAENLLSASEIAGLKAEGLAIASGQRGGVLGAAAQGARTGDEHMADVLAVHFPHKVSEPIRAAMHHPAVVRILTSLIGPNVKAMQTMLFVKAAGKPGQAWHQDETYIPTRDRSLCGAWIALDDATIENGCLWFHPGSQQSGVLWRTQPHGDIRFDPSDEAVDHPFDRESGVPVELKAGGVAFFNGYVLHRSLPNRAASGYRRALVTHYMSAESLLPWSIGFPPTRRTDYRDIEMIAGRDPHAWKGVRDESLPFVRLDDAARVAGLLGAYTAEAEHRRRVRPGREDDEP
jgi:ectoine hydroxylase-related dioxygenase (phytanoyl-CoA dioxygenase family)